MKNYSRIILGLSYLIAVVLIFGCRRKNCEMLQSHEHEIVLEDGIFVEEFDEAVTDQNRYNGNNEIYEICNVLKYSFIFEDTLGDEYYFELEDGALDLPTPIEQNKAWSYVLKGDASNKTIKTINQKIKPGLAPFIKIIPDYNQTVFDYFYESKNNDKEIGEITGLIENEKNVWMHPPRQMMFRILELNPFPFIQAPYEIGTRWEWNYLRPSGEEWSDERWLVWEGNLELNCEYEITDFLSVNSSFGEIECYEITALGYTDYGTTKLVSYFNTQYGFVKLDYTNINNTKITIELMETKK